MAARRALPGEAEKARAALKKWRQGTGRHYKRDRRLKDPAFRIAANVAGRFKSYFNSQGKGNRRFKTFGYVECTPEQLRDHIQSLWLPGMSWENYGIKGWHIDHIRPISSFNFFDAFGNENVEQVKASMHYTNFQPLWYADNIRKGNKISL